MTNRSKRGGLPAGGVSAGLRRTASLRIAPGIETGGAGEPESPGAGGGVGIRAGL
jgi:hypothetical protein